jgi:hypothetical protein
MPQASAAPPAAAAPPTLPTAATAGPHAPRPRKQDQLDDAAEDFIEWATGACRQLEHIAELSRTCQDDKLPAWPRDARFNVMSAMIEAGMPKQSEKAEFVFPADWRKYADVGARAAIAELLMLRGARIEQRELSRFHFVVEALDDLSAPVREAIERFRAAYRSIG